eukprot:Mycagemm_TRINITY_DN8081_c0_g1::TRINITY_DN8081_c0_g1_i1::g.4469::m.4469 type:complete len:108 gc:universal TRINITY_DN8081_c0_g1_i1:517-194(-)
MVVCAVSELAGLDDVVVETPKVLDRVDSHDLAKLLTPRGLTNLLLRTVVPHYPLVLERVLDGKVGRIWQKGQPLTSRGCGKHWKIAHQQAQQQELRARYCHLRQVSR